MTITHANQHLYRTVDGAPFKLLSTTLVGPLPVCIEADNTLFKLDPELRCPAHEGMSLILQDDQHTRYFNVYRAADGGFVLGKRAFKSALERDSTCDSEHAIARIAIELRGTTRVTAFIA